MSAATRPQPRRGRRIAHLALVVVGLAMVAFAVWRLVDPHLTCRGVDMHPGDVCRKNDFSKLDSEQVQTYEQRLHGSRVSQPTMMVVGLATAGFGAALYRQERRRTR